MTGRVKGSDSEDVWEHRNKTSQGDDTIPALGGPFALSHCSLEGLISYCQQAVCESWDLSPSAANWPSSTCKEHSVCGLTLFFLQIQCASTEQSHYCFLFLFQMKIRSSSLRQWNSTRVVFYSEPLSKCLLVKWMGVRGPYLPLLRTGGRILNSMVHSVL